MVEAFPLLPATRTFLSCYQTILPKARPPIISAHRLIQTLPCHVSQGLVVLLEDAVVCQNPRHHLLFPATEMEELEAIPLQVVKPNLKLRCKFENPLSSLLGDARQVSAQVYKVDQSDILSRIAIPILHRMLEAFLAVNWQGRLSIAKTPAP